MPKSSTRQRSSNNKRTFIAGQAGECWEKKWTGASQTELATPILPRESAYRIDLASPGDPPSVTQLELARLDFLRDMQTSHRQTRANLTKRLEAGVVVERGSLHLFLWVEEVKHWSRGAIKKVLGRAATASLFSNLPDREGYRLLVHSRDPRARCAPQQGQPEGIAATTRPMASRRHLSSRSRELFGAGALGSRIEWLEILDLVADSSGRANRAGAVDSVANNIQTTGPDARRHCQGAGRLRSSPTLAAVAPNPISAAVHLRPIEKAARLARGPQR